MGVPVPFSADSPNLTVLPGKLTSEDLQKQPWSQGRTQGKHVANLFIVGAKHLKISKNPNSLSYLSASYF